MNSMIRHLLVFLALAAFTGAVRAEVTGEVIASQLVFSSNTALMSAANGGQYAEVSCGSDLTHGGSPRYFVYAKASGYLLPDSYQGSDLHAADEACAQSLVIASEPGMRYSNSPHWSPDDTRIAVFGERWDLASGVIAEQGVFAMDVVYDGAGRPIGTENLRLVFSLPGEQAINWAGDGERIVYSDEVSDGAGGSQLDLFVFDLVTEVSTNVTNSPDVSEAAPVFSPVDDRIAYSRLVQVRGTYRFDIFTIDATSGAVVQVTSKKTTGSPANRFPEFSPDGQYLAFSSGSILGPIMPFDLYRIRSDGSGKAVNLTSKKDGDFRYHVWRE